MLGSSIINVLYLAALLPFATATPFARSKHVDLTLVPTTPSEIIPENYIVVFKKGVSQDAIDAHKRNLTNIYQRHQIRGATRTEGIHKSFSLKNFKAYSGTFDKSAINTIKDSAIVNYVEANSIMSVSATQTNSQWNLQRISQLTTLKNQSPYTYNYPSTAGSGVVAYVLDTGIDITHPDFSGRATWGTNVAGDGADYDGVGHGTHCAGIIGSTTFGVAKGVSLVSVKVLNVNGSGSTSTVMEGLQWVMNNMAPGSNPVISMSLGGAYSQAVNDAIGSAMDDGITVVVAAGNDGVDASNTSPASAPSAICVAATDITDTKPSWSNYGTPVDVFAPGVSILSTYPNDQTAYMSGTSMACPHVAGVAALLIAQNGGAMSPAAVRSQIISSASTGTVVNGGANSPDDLVYNNAKTASTTSSTTRSTKTTSATLSIITSKPALKTLTNITTLLMRSTTLKVKTSTSSKKSPTSSKPKTTSTKRPTASKAIATPTSISSATPSKAATALTCTLSQWLLGTCN